MSALAGLAGRVFGPFPVEADAVRVAAFVAATGDDPVRWIRAVPPFFANAALFAAAPAFLGDPEVGPFTRSLIHSDQHYAWSRALRVGETVQVTGTVTAVRARGPLNLVTFDIAAGNDQGPWLDGSSGFLLSDGAAAAADEASEPPVDDRPPFGAAGGGAPRPGDPLPPFPCGASRFDLVRYAAASGDSNPIHWDHAAARAAGLGGTIVHGLLMAAWMGLAASRWATGEAPLREARIRFRSPLRPGQPAVITGVAAEEGQFDVALEAAGERLATGRIRVTP